MPRRNDLKTFGKYKLIPKTWDIEPHTPTASIRSGSAILMCMYKLFFVRCWLLQENGIFRSVPVTTNHVSLWFFNFLLFFYVVTSKPDDLKRSLPIEIIFSLY